MIRFSVICFLCLLSLCFLHIRSLNPVRTIRKIVATPVTVSVESAKLIKEGIYGTIDLIKSAPDTVSAIGKIPNNIKQFSTESILATQTRIDSASRAYRSTIKAVAPENLFSYYVKELKKLVSYVYEFFDTKNQEEIQQKEKKSQIRAKYLKRREEIIALKDSLYVTFDNVQRIPSYAQSLISKISSIINNTVKNIEKLKQLPSSVTAATIAFEEKVNNVQKDIINTKNQWDDMLFDMQEQYNNTIMQINELPEKIKQKQKQISEIPSLMTYKYEQLVLQATAIPGNIERKTEEILAIPGQMSADVQRRYDSFVSFINSGRRMFSNEKASQSSSYITTAGTEVTPSLRYGLTSKPTSSASNVVTATKGGLLSPVSPTPSSSPLAPPKPTTPSALKRTLSLLQSVGSVVGGASSLIVGIVRGISGLRKRIYAALEKEKLRSLNATISINSRKMEDEISLIAKEKSNGNVTSYGWNPQDVILPAETDIANQVIILPNIRNMTLVGSSQNATV